MKIAVYVIIFSVLSMFSPNLYALTEISSLGGVETVAVSGTIDGARNPALLPIGAPYFSVMTAGMYRYYSNTDVTATGTVTADVMSVDPSSPKSQAFSTIFGVARRGENSGFAFCFSSSGDPQFEKTKSKTKSKIGSPVTSTQVENKEEKKFNPAADLSWGIRTSDKASFGIRFTGGMSQVETDTEKFISGAPPSTQNINRWSRLVFGELSLGFFMHDNGTEAGAMITSGKAGRYKERYEISDSPAAFHAKRETASKFIMAEPPRFKIGIVQPVAPSLRFVFEYTSGMPHSYSYDTYEYNSTLMMIDKQNVEVHTRYTFTGNAGLIYKVSPVVTVMGGLTAILFSTDTTTKVSGAESHSRTKIYGTGLSAGTDVAVSRNATIGISSSFAYVRMKGNYDTPGQTLRLKARIFQGDVIAAAMYTF